MESLDLEWLRESFDPDALGPENIWDAVDFMLDKCPVAHGRDQKGDFYIVSRYETVFGLVTDNQTFENSYQARIGVPELPFAMPPIDSNPPLQRQLRKILNPFFAPQAVRSYETAAREIIRGFLASFPDGPFDIASTLFQPLPPTLTFCLLLGLDTNQLQAARDWIDGILFSGEEAQAAAAAGDLIAWLHDLVTARRMGQDPTSAIVDALIAGTVEDERPLSDQEIVGTLLILLMGGFVTTTDASSSFLVRLTENPALQAQLRADQTLLPPALEEHLRLMPPAPLMPRRCVVDTQVEGRDMKAGDRVAWLPVAANRDPGEFDRPKEFDLTRRQNRHLAFGAGIHRCIGSHFARMNLRLIFEELFSAFSDIQAAPGESVRWVAKGGGAWYNAENIPVVMTRAS